MKNTKTSQKIGFDFSYPWLDVSRTTAVQCCFCESKSTKDLLHFTVNRKDFFIKQCRNDGLMFLYPQPSDRYLTALYNHPSYYAGLDDMYGLKVDEKKSEKIAKIRIQEIKKYKKNANSFLEIGCAHGHTLIEAKESGIKKVTGIEFSDRAVIICKQKKLDVHLSKKNFGFLSGSKYDVVAMYSVLEHVKNPLIFLKKVAKYLDDDGVLIVRVPEMSEHGPWLSLLDHFWHFSKESLNILFKTAGLRIIDIFPSGKFLGIQHNAELYSITIVATVKYI